MACKRWWSFACWMVHLSYCIFSWKSSTRWQAQPFVLQPRATRRSHRSAPSLGPDYPLLGGTDDVYLIASNHQACRGKQLLRAQALAIHVSSCRIWEESRWHHPVGMISTSLGPVISSPTTHTRRSSTTRPLVYWVRWCRYLATSWVNTPDSYSACVSSTHSAPQSGRFAVNIIGMTDYRYSLPFDNIRAAAEPAADPRWDQTPACHPSYSLLRFMSPLFRWSLAISTTPASTADSHLSQLSLTWPSEHDKTSTVKIVGFICGINATLWTGMKAGIMGHLCSMLAARGVVLIRILLRGAGPPIGTAWGGRICWPLIPKPWDILAELQSRLGLLRRCWSLTAFMPHVTSM